MDTRPRAWRDDEVALVQELADRIWTRLERARAEAALRESEARLRALVSTTSEVLYDMSPDWAEMRTLTGGGFLADTPQPSRTWLEAYIPADERPRVLAAIRQAIAMRGAFELEHRVRRADGGVGCTLSRAVPILGPDGGIVEWFGTASDVTAARHAAAEREQRLVAEVAASERRALLEAVVRAQEDERQHLARELHDEIGQALTGLQLQLASFARGHNGRDAALEAEQIVRELTTRVSALSIDLRPSALDSFGLLPALLSHRERFQARTGLRIDLRHAGLDRRFCATNRDHRVPSCPGSAYQCCSTLGRTRRHGAVARRRRYSHRIHSRRWPGVRSQIQPTSGGLSGMRERVELLGGTLTIDSAPTHGNARHGRSAAARPSSLNDTGSRALINVAVADDHPIVRQGLRGLLEGEEGCHVIGEAADGLTAIELITRLRPEIVILDVQLPDLNGLEVARRVHEQVPCCRVVMLSMFADEAYVLEALRFGAMAYVLKASATSDVVAAVHAAIEGRRYLSAPLNERAIDAYARRAADGSRPPDRYEMLTSREREVLQLAAQGLNNADFGHRLVLSPRTVETHHAKLLRKLGLQTQTDLVRFAVGRGLIAAADDRLLIASPS
jgi:DNA-binding NarL/FixJ family response regulator